MDLYKSFAIFVAFFDKLFPLSQKLRKLEFDLSRNFLTDLDLVHFSKKIEVFSHLSSFSLDLQHNYIGGIGLISLSQSLISLKSLRHLSLDLSWCCIKEFSIEKLGESLRFFEDLAKLELVFDWNSLHFSQYLQLFHDLDNLFTLKYLLLSFGNSDFNDDCCEIIASFIEKLHNLQWLSLNFYWNSIGDAGFANLVRKISESAKFLKRLELNFDNNKISDCGLLCLCSVLRDFEEMTDFSLKMYDNLIDLSFLELVGEIYKKKSLFSAVFHLGKCIYNEETRIIAKTEGSQLLFALDKRLKFKALRRKQLFLTIFAIKCSNLRRFYRTEIIEELISLCFY